jgi:hypothetical protein
MGMDVYGKSGNYFRNNVWWWHPLADYILEIAPDVAANCKHWHTNDGDGLSADNAARLADILEAEIASGRTAEYAALREASIEALPDEQCQWCEGTGIRTDRIGQEMRMPQRPIPADQVGHPRAGQIGWCNGCDGVGHVRPFKAHYPFDVGNVKEFAEFCRASEGFEIC